MEITDKDFGLILGAPCRCLDGLGKVRIGTIAYVTPKNGVVFVDIPEDFRRGYPHFQITLILRHRNSLTEAEARELYALAGETWEEAYPDGGLCLSDWWNEVEEWYCDKKHQVIGDPKAWRWLLAHHFDLFGWIEAGLALDAAKQETV